MSRVWRVATGVIWTTVLLAACRTAGIDSDHADTVAAAPPRDSSPVQTDSVSYRLARLPGAYRAWVMATYRNATGSPVYFKRCGGSDTLPMFGIARTGADSASSFFSDWAWACVGLVPTGTLAPGQSVTVRVQFGSVDQPNMQPPLRPEQLVGLFRIELALCETYSADSDRCVAPALAERRSNAFLVHY